MRNRMRIGLAILLTVAVVAAALLISPVAMGAESTSTRTNTGGGVSSYSILSLACDSAHNLLYAGTELAGVWKYDGTTWTDTGGGVSGDVIYSLAYDSAHNLLYAGTWSNGVWKYDGTTWTNTAGGVSGYDIFSLAYDSAHNVLYAGTGSNGVWKYDGANWTNTNGGVSGYEIYSLTYDSVHNVLYAGTFGHGVWKYHGTTWTDTGGGVSSYYIDSLAYDSGHNLLYAGCYDDSTHSGIGVWKYDGTTWTDTAGGVSSYIIDSLAYDSAHNLLYAGTGSNGVWEYDGTTWTGTGGVSTYPTGSLAYDSGHNVLYAGTNSKGVWKYDGANWTNFSSSTYYFAEGTCRPGFDPYLCIQNPGNTDATVHITYMKGDGTTDSQDLTVPKNSRATVSPRDKLGTGDDAAHDFSTKVECTNGQTIVAERPMYFNYKGVWTGGHDVVGATSTASTFDFAEGTCRPNFETYFCIQNPGSTDAAVTINYMKGDGSTDTQTLTVGKNSRSTVRVKDKLGEANDSAHDFSSEVNCTNGQEIVVERPMYFNYKGVWTGGSDVIGATALTPDWYVAEGTTRASSDGEFQEWLCILNPLGITVTVGITYMLDNGQNFDKTYHCPPGRTTVNVNTDVGTGHDVSAVINAAPHIYPDPHVPNPTEPSPIAVERVMYFNYKGAWTGGSAVVGETSPFSTYYFAEGTCRPGFDPYFCIQNPGDTDANVKITYMKGDGSTATRDITVPKNSRYTVNARDTLGTGDDPAHDFSAKVECINGQTIIAERPMYFNYKGVWTGGHDVVGFHY